MLDSLRNGKLNYNLKIRKVSNCSTVQDVSSTIASNRVSRRGLGRRDTGNFHSGTLKLVKIIWYFIFIII